MRLVIQRVRKASVSVDGALVSKIGHGLLVLAGLGRLDTEKDLDAAVRKILTLRVFPDGEKEGAFTVTDTGGEVLAVSQFTLYGDVSRGRRPSFSQAMPPAEARAAFELFSRKLSDAWPGKVRLGVFQVMMDVSLVNDGPYTIVYNTDPEGEA